MNKKSYGFLFISLVSFFIFIIVFDNKNLYAQTSAGDEASVCRDYLDRIKIAAAGLSVNISNEKCAISRDAHGDERLFFEASAGFLEAPELFRFLDALFEKAVTAPSEIAAIDAAPPEKHGGSHACVFSFIKGRASKYAADTRGSHFQAFKKAVAAASSEYNLKLSRFYYLRNGRIDLEGASRSLDGILAFIDHLAAYQAVEKFSCVNIDKKYDARARQFYYRFQISAALY